MSHAKEEVRPFSCGSQYGDWRSRNCYRCVKSYENTKPEPKDGMGPCDIDNAVGMAYIGSGSVTPEIAKRMGYSGENEGAYGWDCPERELTGGAMNCGCEDGIHEPDCENNPAAALRSGSPAKKGGE